MDSKASMALAADGRAPRVDVTEVSTAGVRMLSELQYCLRVSKGRCTVSIDI